MNHRLSVRWSFVLVIVAVLVAVAIALVLRQRSAVRELYASLTAGIVSLEQGYVDIAQQQALPLLETASLNDNQRSALLDAQSILAIPVDQLSLLERVEHTRNLLKALRTFVDATPPSHPLAQEQAFEVLSRSLSDQGDVKKILQQYNDLAKQWNNTLQESKTHWMAEQMNLDTEKLPYFRYDGTEETGKLQL